VSVLPSRLLQCWRFLVCVQVAAVSEDSYPVRWLGRQAVVALPEHIDVTNAGQIREELLSVINRGAVVLIADMAATISCDHAGAEAVARAYQRAVVSGTQLRLVVTAGIVRRVISLSGLDRLVPVYPSLEAATAAGEPAGAAPLTPRPARAGTAGQEPGGAAGPRRGERRAGPENVPRAAGITPAVLWGLVDALTDGVALVDGDGLLALANRRLAEMSGYEQAELIGLTVEALIPADLRPAHRGYRADYAQAPEARPMSTRAPLVGLRKDGATFPVEVSLSPVPTATGHLTLAVIRSRTQTQTQQRADLVDLARAAVEEQEHRGRELLDRVVQNLFHVGLSLQAATSLPTDQARRHITQALQRLDDTIHEIRDHLFPTHG
jgi:anti-anti-sigma factor